jgi:hypothetical protein
MDKFVVEKLETKQVTFSGVVSHSKSKKVFSTNNYVRALKFAYKEYIKYGGHDLKSLCDNYVVKENGVTVCTFGFYVNKIKESD